MDENVKVINLTQNRQALVDSVDYVTINAHKWFYDSSGYAARNTKHPVTGHKTKFS